jgi:hypothetical protein
MCTGGSVGFAVPWLSLTQLSAHNTCIYTNLGSWCIHHSFTLVCSWTLAACMVHACCMHCKRQTIEKFMYCAMCMCLQDDPSITAAEAAQVAADVAQALARKAAEVAMAAGANNKEEAAEVAMAASANNKEEKQKVCNMGARVNIFARMPAMHVIMMQLRKAVALCHMCAHQLQNVKCLLLNACCFSTCRGNIRPPPAATLRQHPPIECRSSRSWGMEDMLQHTTCHPICRWVGGTRVDQ